MLDDFFGKLKGIQIDANVGNGQPAGVSVSLGNRNVVSGVYVGIAIVIGVLIGIALFGGRK